MLPVARVAVILDLTRQAVQQQIGRGHLLAVKVGKTFLVPLGEVERWRPVKAGRPRNVGYVVAPMPIVAGTAHHSLPSVDENETGKISSQGENN
jgi:hypothetical protein